MINPLDLRPDLAEALSTYDSNTDHGLLMIITTAFIPNNDFNVEAQLAFVMTMTLSVIPTVEAYKDTVTTSHAERFALRDFRNKLPDYWKHNWLCKPGFIYESPLKPVGSQHQALDEAYLVLAACDEILHSRATVGSFERIIDDVTEGYAILPGHESIQQIRDWMFNEVIPYCAAGALPPFIYTIDGIKPTTAALKQLLNHD